MYFNLKDLFIKKDETEAGQETPVEAAKVAPMTFSNTNGSPTMTPSSLGSVSTEVLNKVVEMYQKGFDALNLPGPDFWEFYTVVTKTPNPTAETYQTAFMMLGTMADLPKNKLVEHGGYYVTKINEQHKAFAAQGNQKIADLLAKKDTEESQLKSEEATISQQIQELQKRLVNTQQNLRGVEAKYQVEHSQLVETVSANDAAKDHILGRITAVIDGIKTNIK
jgi:uncharacterized protein involved in exopolysaccharide biosynthesis